MNRFNKPIAIFFCLMFTVCGCFTAKHPGNKINYYTLEYPPPKMDNPKRLPAVIRVERFTVAPLYNSNKIVYQENQYRRDTYHYHKWRANPGDLVTYFLARDLKASSLFQAVFSLDSRLSSSHLIEGTVDEFFELDVEGDSWNAVLSVSITLLTEEEPDISKKVVFQRQYKEIQACAQRNPAAIAEAMSVAMSRISESIIQDIYNGISSQEGKG